MNWQQKETELKQGNIFLINSKNISTKKENIKRTKHSFNEHTKRNNGGGQGNKEQRFTAMLI